jgi:hypothetical protein
MLQTLSLAFALYRSRYLGAVFLSPATTLSRHFGVNDPVLHLRFPAEYLRGSVRYRAPALRSVSRPIRGAIAAQHPFPAPISGALVSSASLRSPLGTFVPSGSKRSTGIHHVKLVLRNSDLRLLPVAISFDFAPDQRSRSAASRLTNRSVNHSHAEHPFSSKMRLVFRLPLAAAAFQPASGQCCKRSLWLSQFTGAGISVRSFTRPQRRFHAIPGSMFPSCTFDSTPKTFAGPFDPGLLRSVRFRGRSGALSSPNTRFPRRFSALTWLLPAPAPPWVLSHPPDQSVQPASPREARLAWLRSPLAPRGDLFRFHPGSTLAVRCALLD